MLPPTLRNREGYLIQLENYPEIESYTELATATGRSRQKQQSACVGDALRKATKVLEDRRDRNPMANRQACVVMHEVHLELVFPTGEITAVYSCGPGQQAVALAGAGVSVRLAGAAGGGAHAPVAQPLGAGGGCVCGGWEVEDGMER